jgi:hypothetical protein
MALFLFMCGLFSVNAQDLIILKDGNIIEAKVLEISPTEIRYKRFDHLDGPTIIVMAVDVLSIRYENGKTEIINAASQLATTPQRVPSQQPTVSDANRPFRSPRLNTIGGTVGYLGISNFGFSLNGTVSPAPYTFFDFNIGLGFAAFSFNGNINFCGFVPFGNNGWYGGIGMGGGVLEVVDSMNGFFAINAVTGLLFFNWLNISATLQMELAPEFNVRIRPMVGYAYRFKTRSNNISNETYSHKARNVSGMVQQKVGNTWRNVMAGDVFNLDTIVRIGRSSSLTIVDGNNNVTLTYRTNSNGLSISELISMETNYSTIK